MNELGLLTRLGLLLVRPGALIMTAPVFGGAYAPMQVKVGLTALVAFVLLPIVELPREVTVGGMAVIALREFAIGAALAMAIRVIVAGAELAGQLSGFQIGLSYAAIVDPQSGVRNNILAALYSSLTLITFLGVNGHHMLLRALSESYRALPVGPGGLNASLPGTVASMLGTVFGLGLRLALPVVMVLLLVELALGLVSRVAPALNLMVIGFPLRLLVGVVALAATIGVAPGVITGLVETALGLAVRAAAAFR